MQCIRALLVPQQVVRHSTHTMIIKKGVEDLRPKQSSWLPIEGGLKEEKQQELTFSLVTPVFFKLLRQDAFYFVMKIKANKVL